MSSQGSLSTQQPLAIESLSLWQDYRQDDVKEIEGTNEYLSVLLQKETTLYLPCDDYLTRVDTVLPSLSLDSHPVSEGWRRKLSEWCFEVVDHFKFDREAVAIAMNYLDRSVSKWTIQHGAAIPKREYQLYAVTALYMAIKIHGETDNVEGPRRKLKIEAFHELSRKQFEVKLIEDTERHILDAINWNVNPPTALKFIATYLFLCPKWHCSNGRAMSHASVIGGIYDVARYVTELSVCQSFFSFSYKTSVVAYAAVLVSIESVSATLPLPYDAYVQLLNNIAMTTGLGPSDPDVLTVCDMLKKLCPNLFNSDDLPTFLHQNEDEESSETLSLHGKSSPVCVVETPDIYGANRKRNRTVTDDAWRPIHHNGI